MTSPFSLNMMPPLRLLLVNSMFKMIQLSTTRCPLITTGVGGISDMKSK